MIQSYRTRAKHRPKGIFHRDETSEAALSIALVSAINQRDGGARSQMEAERAEQQLRWAEQNKQKRKAESRTRHEQEREKLRPLDEFAVAVQEAGIPATMHLGNHPSSGKPAAILTFPDQVAHTRFVKSELFSQGLAIAKRAGFPLVAALQNPKLS